MALDDTMRVDLEKYIEKVIAEIPDAVSFLLSPSNKAQLQIENRDDFVFGLALGNIQGMLATHFYNKKGRLLNEEEFKEAGSIMFKRVGDIHKAIFNAG
jgi:hypothetical protein